MQRIPRPRFYSPLGEHLWDLDVQRRRRRQLAKLAASARAQAESINSLVIAVTPRPDIRK